MVNRLTKQATAERRAAALRMRRDGKTYAEIAPALGYANANHASKDVCRALDKTVAEEGRALLMLERERTEALLARAVELMASDDMKAVRAVEAAVKVLERRARMLGIDKAADAHAAETRTEDAKSVAGQLAAAVHTLYATCPTPTPPADPSWHPEHREEPTP